MVVIQIDIEVLIILLILLLLFAWFIWFKVSNYLNKRRYNPENDKSRKGEERRRELIAEGEPDPIEEFKRAAASPPRRKYDNERLAESSDRKFLSSADAFSDGEAGNSPRKTRKKFRNPFRRRK